MNIPKATQLPSGAWRVQMQIKGERISLTAESEEAAIAKAAEIRAGKDTGPLCRDSLRYCLNAYIRKRKDILSPATLAAYESYRTNHFLDYMDRKISQVDWQDAINREKALGTSPKMLKNAWMLCSAAMAEKGFRPKVKLPRIPKTGMKWLTPEQIPKFLDAVRDQPCELAALLGLHSLRRSEMFGLTWEESVDLEMDFLYIRGVRIMAQGGKVVSRAENKTVDSMRDVPIMIPRLRELLEAVEDKTGYVLKEHISTPLDQINALCRKNGLPEVGVHGLRRSFASLGYHLKMSEEEIMSIGGWRDFQTVHKFYIYLSDLDRKKAINKMKVFYSPDLVPTEASHETPEALKTQAV